MAIVKVGREDVDLKDEILVFSPENINEFLTKFPALHRYYQNKHNDASYIAKTMNDKHTVLFNAKFREYKIGQNLSDKTAEACAKSDEEVVLILEKVRVAEYVKEEIGGFLKSMDYAHSNCKELCYNLRKELNALYPQHVMTTQSRDEMEEKLKDLYSKDR